MAAQAIDLICGVHVHHTRRAGVAGDSGPLTPLRHARLVLACRDPDNPRKSFLPTLVVLSFGCLTEQDMLNAIGHGSTQDSTLTGS